MVEWKASQGILTKDDDTSKLSLHVLLRQNLHNVMGIRSIRLMDGKIGWKRTQLNGTRGQNLLREKTKETSQAGLQYLSVLSAARCPVRRGIGRVFGTK
jgi:hypothetical protein